MRRILLAGAPTGCWTNLGDEAILAGMTTSLRATWSEVALTVVSSNPPGFLDRYDCQAVPFRDVEAIAEAVAASDLVLLGGGSIFYDYWACDPRGDADTAARGRRPCWPGRPCWRPPTSGR